MTIRFKLPGTPNDGENGKVHTLKAGNLETWLDDSYTFNAEDLSAESVLRLLWARKASPGAEIHKTALELCIYQVSKIL